MKSEVYSWRISSGLKQDLERAARRRKVSVSAVLDAAVREWLEKNALDIADDDEQRQLHIAAEACLGVLKGRNPRRAENTASLIRKSLRRRYGRR
jgi:hypothetical protein